MGINRSAHMATSWVNTGNPKFYEGNKCESIWNQCLHQRSVNEKESKYLLEIQAGTHDSQALLKGKREGPFAIDTARSSQASGISKVSSARMDGAIGELKDFNDSLRGELKELKDYLHSTYDRLERAEKGMLSGRSGASPASGRRSSRTTARSGSSRASTARSEVEKVLASARSAINRSSPTKQMGEKQFPALNLGSS